MYGKSAYAASCELGISSFFLLSFLPQLLPVSPLPSSSSYGQLFRSQAVTTQQQEEAAQTATTKDTLKPPYFF